MAGIYIHIPFCKARCRYCDFTSYAGRAADMPAYLSALEKEIDRWAVRAQDTAFETVFIGGGTPSILPLGAVAHLVAALYRHFTIVPQAEVTLEANPGTLTAEKLTEYRESGINRLSIGLQTADGGLLRALGRIHTYPVFEENYKLARAAGFSHINVDLMYGLPGQGFAQWRDTLERVTALAPEHISAYSLILEEGTALYADVQAGRAAALPGEDAEDDMAKLARSLLASRGYSRYEISNFARPGQECRHNLNYWQNGDFIGLGCAAHGYFGGERYENTAELCEYIGRMQAGKGPVAARSYPSGNDALFETLMMGLRMVRGVPLAALEGRYGAPLPENWKKLIHTYESGGLMRLENGRLALTERGLDVQNPLLVAFLQALDNNF